MKHEWKLSDISALEDCGHQAQILIDKRSIPEPMVVKRIEKRLVVRYKAGVYGIGLEDERNGIWLQRLNREPGEEKILAFEPMVW